ncbi:fumarylacetoacetate hydrolase family protein [Thermoactinomyces mirandus]|uniref:Fumarylacetoacetate hydrolase family protein n=1 Tax=Thermoactinomyces mirandus TaxID=2756294 RepID=A0A7W1XRH0_9BACL|nr:fumarylacetoacetate hydrolase family protein [Thermoactinomyces mirandus]MBA4601944.1 fumarylacetoacetate hydrolase family protein [Thermoactinomyces mirandus]
METIRNIYCIGRNYRLHAEELGNEVPHFPLVFLKPTRSVVKANGQEIILPGDCGQVHYEMEWILYISQSKPAGTSVDQVVGQMALGIDFTLRDVQSELKKKGHPWLLAKGFRNSAAITRFRPFPGFEKCLTKSFSLFKNGERVQLGKISDMLFSPQQLIDYCAEHFGLGEGDVIFTGTPAGVGKVKDHDHLELYWEDEKMGECFIRIGK